jgi:hypothetical protein
VPMMTVSTWKGCISLIVGMSMPPSELVSGLICGLWLKESLKDAEAA